jgi:Golgi nucleoside diphosphatase
MKLKTVAYNIFVQYHISFLIYIIYYAYRRPLTPQTDNFMILQKAGVVVAGVVPADKWSGRRLASEAEESQEFPRNWNTPSSTVQEFSNFHIIMCIYFKCIHSSVFRVHPMIKSFGIIENKILIRNFSITET